MTIEGGSGWQLDAGPRDALDSGGDPAPPSPRAGRGRQLGALALAAALGFAAATALAEQRQTRLADSDEGVLSLDAGGAHLDRAPQLVRSSDGSPAVLLTVRLRNTGPRPVALDAVELVDTGFVAEDVAGRRVDAGGRTAVRLLHAVRCEALPEDRPPGPLRIRATTGAGSQTAELRIDILGLGFSREFLRASCGLSPPGQSLVALQRTPAHVVGDRIRVTSELSNASAAPLLLQSLRLPAGLGLVGLHDRAGEELALPLVLPPGDYDPPTEPFRGRGPAQVVVATLEVQDCAALLAAADSDVYHPLFDGTVTDAAGRDPDGRYGAFGVGSSAWGDGSVVERIRGTACPPPAGEESEPPARARPGSAFLSPD